MYTNICLHNTPYWHGYAQFYVHENIIQFVEFFSMQTKSGVHVNNSTWFVSDDAYRLFPFSACLYLFTSIEHCCASTFSLRVNKVLLVFIVSHNLWHRRKITNNRRLKTKKARNMRAYFEGIIIHYTLSLPPPLSLFLSFFLTKQRINYRIVTFKYMKKWIALWNGVCWILSFHPFCFSLSLHYFYHSFSFRVRLFGKSLHHVQHPTIQSQMWDMATPVLWCLLSASIKNTVKSK